MVGCQSAMFAYPLVDPRDVDHSLVADNNILKPVLPMPLAPALHGAEREPMEPSKLSLVQELDVMDCLSHSFYHPSLYPAS